MRSKLLQISFLFLCSTLFISTAIMAQTSDKIVVKAGEDNVRAMNKGKIYRYPAFQQGQVHFMNGRSNTSQLNYNIFSGELEFIDKKGDTLALESLTNISNIRIGEDIFYYDPINTSLLELVGDYNTSKLFVKQKYKLANSKKIGAYGMESSSASPTSVKDFYSPQNGTHFKLKPNEELVFKREVSFYLMDQNHLFQKASKPTALKIYSRHKPAVEKYIKEQKLDFNKEEDLKKFLSYCSTLQ